MPLKWTRSDWLVILLFAILVLLFHWRILTPNLADRQSFPPGDFSHQFWVFATHEARELQAGRLPLWNPYTFAGAPFWADVQSAVFYPPSLLTILLTAPWGFSLFALEIEAIAHFWLAAVFMYLFVRALTDHRPAALVAALTFTFSGYLTGYPSQQLAVLETDVWLPLILHFQTKAVRSQASLLTSPYLILAGTAWGVALLAGHPQSAFIVAIVSMAYFGFLIQNSRRLSVSPSGSTGSPDDAFRAGSAGIRPKLSRRLKFWKPNSFLAPLLPLAIYLTIGLALAAVQFIPAFEYTRLSVRAAGTYAAMSGGFPFVDLLQLVLPGLLTTYSPLYVSMVGLLLAFAATFGRHEHQQQTTFWAMGAFIALLVSFGGNSFLYSPLYLSVPGFAIFRGQERWAFTVTFSLCVLVGYGFKAVMEHRVNIDSRLENPPTEPDDLRFNNFSRQCSEVLRNACRYVFIFMILLLAASFYGLNDTGWQADNPFYKLLSLSTFLSLILGLAWLLWGRMASLSPPMLTGLMAFLVCLDLFTLTWQTNLYPQLPEWHTQKPTIVQAIQADAAAESLSPHEFRVYNEYRLYDNYGVAFQLEDLWGASPLRPSRYDEFIQPLPIEAGWKLKLLNVKYVITWREQLVYLPSTVIHQEPTSDGITYVHRLTEQTPRAWVVYQTERVEQDMMLQRLADPTFDPWQLALVEPSPSLALPDSPSRDVKFCRGFELSHRLTLTPPPLPQRERGDSSPPPKVGRARVGGSHGSCDELRQNEDESSIREIIYHSPQAISIEAETTAPSLLILSEPHYPGWQATVNGRATPIERANYLLRAIPLPAGNSQVELTFRPPTFIIGAVISGLTLIVISLSLILAYRQKIV